ncbi:hypothetical protein OG730_15005 [Streptomyces sp. NBC_01298]|nr:hypothetical protein OG730_15005 [Streptomyces sp. NBC_01298]
MSDDNEHQAHAQHTRASVALMTAGSVLWVFTVAVIVAKGWGV